MKRFVLDTSTLLCDSDSIFKFQENEVVLPITVIEELDNRKKDNSEIGRNARQVARYLNEYLDNGDIRKGIVINKEGGILRVDTRYSVDAFDVDLPLDYTKNDNRIINCAYINDAIIVSRDVNLRIVASAYNIPSEDYKNDRLDSKDKLYTGRTEIEIPSTLIDKIYQVGKLDLSDLDGIEIKDTLYPNICCTFYSEGNRKQTALTVYNSIMKEFKLLPQDSKTMGMLPRNAEQQYLLELLKNDDIKLVTVSGVAGSGKNLISLLAGLYGVMEVQKYKRLLLYKPIVPMDNSHEIGYRPGTTIEKLMPWMSSYSDNLEVIFSQYFKEDEPVKRKKSKKNQDIFEDKDQAKLSPLLELVSLGLVEMGDLETLRGRSLPDQYIIGDECITGDTKIIVDTDSGKETIGTLYKKYKKNIKLPLVKTFNEKTEKFEFKEIEKVINKGDREIFNIEAGDRIIKCTGNHPFLTLNNGWINAENLTSGMILKCSEPNLAKISKVLNDDQLQVLMGSYLGDGSISKTSLGTYRLKISNCEKQKDYLFHKASIFENSTVGLVEHNGYAQTKQYAFNTLTFGSEYEFPDGPKTTVPNWILENIDARGLAIWFQDDGSSSSKSKAASIHTESFDIETQYRLVNMLKDRFDIDAKVKTHYRKDTNKSYTYLGLNKDAYLKLINLIAPYVHPVMGYKVKEIPKEKLNIYKWNCNYKNYGAITVKNVVNTKKEDIVYDITIKDNHNFIIASKVGKKYAPLGGPILHNCQNLSRAAILTLVSRIGEGSKIILLGCIEQIDSPYLDSQTNALSITIDAFKDQNIAAHITLKKSERSELAQLASELL